MWAAIPVVTVSGAIRRAHFDVVLPRVGGSEAEVEPLVAATFVVAGLQ